MTSRTRSAFGAVLIVVVCTSSGVLQAQDKPVSEKNLVSLIELRIDDAAIVAKLQKGGLSFSVDDAALDRLRKAGASAGVLTSVQEAAKSKATAPGQAITYQQVLQLVSIGIDEASILKRLETSPTLFTLDAAQVAELKQAGASPRLLDAMQKGRAITPSAAEMITDFAIILDVSGSMREKTTDGVMKLTTAKRVVTELVQKIPDGLNVTFVLYGHKVFGGPTDPRNCQAVEVVRPISPLTAEGKSELVSMIAGLQPTGATPIALSLRTAGAELAKNNAPCGLILITDGLESCHGDPIAEAAALVGKLKITFGVNVVGFGVKPEENQALKQIADAGKGKYYSADSSAELSDALQKMRKELELVALPPEADDVLINLAAAANGGVFVDCPAEHIDNPARNLIDSPAAGTFTVRSAAPLSVVVGFQDGKAGRISAVAVNPATSEDKNNWVSRVEVEVSATYPFTGFKSMGTFDVPAVADDAVLRFDESVVARYVRFNFLKPGAKSGDYMTAAEVMVLGTLMADDGKGPPPMANVALAANGGKVIKISSEYERETGGQNLIDGSPGKSWWGNSGGGQMAVIELARPADVSYVAINPYNTNDMKNWGQSAEILVSMSDPIGYKSVGKITLGPIGRDYVLALRTPVKAKFVKVMMAATGAWSVEANEIKVFAQSESASGKQE